MTRYFVFFVCSFFTLSFAQSQFQRTFGGNGDENGLCIIKCNDGGFVVTGSTRSFGAGYDDIYILKLDANGLLQWSKTIGSSSFTYNDIGWSIIQTFDGGYAVTGLIGTFGAGGQDMYILKLDSNGSFLWNKTIGGGTYDYSRSVIQTLDGGYAIAGFTSSFGAGNNDMIIVKLDAIGNLQWCKTIGGSGNDYAFSILQSPDGSYAVGGASYSFSASEDVYILKLDQSGNLIWNKTIGGNSNDYIYSLIQTTDGGYAAAGSTLSYGSGITDFYVLKLNSSGILLWSRVVGGTSYDDANSIIQTTDGGYSIAGITQSFGAGLYDMFIVKFDPNGAIQWSKTVGGTNYDYCYSILQMSDGSYISLGMTHSFGLTNYNVYLVKLDAAGNTCGNSTSPVSFFGTGGGTGSPFPIIAAQIPILTTPSPTLSSGGTSLPLCVTGIQPVVNEIPSSFALFQNYPNPFNPVTHFKLWIADFGLVQISVFNILGEKVAELVNEELKPGTYEVEFDGTNLASGVYYYTLSAGEYKETKKMILVK